jgi:hypothetical protein
VKEGNKPKPSIKHGNSYHLSNDNDNKIVITTKIKVIIWVMMMIITTIINQVIV